MKKNKMLRMASALLVLTLLTTCIIGGTFAKYTTSGTATDTARVAKWGVKVECTGNAFEKNIVRMMQALPQLPSLSLKSTM